MGRDGRSPSRLRRPDSGTPTLGAPLGRPCAAEERGEVAAGTSEEVSARRVGEPPAGLSVDGRLHRRIAADRAGERPRDRILFTRTHGLRELGPYRVSPDSIAGRVNRTILSLGNQDDIIDTADVIDIKVKG